MKHISWQFIFFLTSACCVNTPVVALAQDVKTLTAIAGGAGAVAVTARNCCKATDSVWYQEVLGKCPAGYELAPDRDCVKDCCEFTYTGGHKQYTIGPAGNCNLNRSPDLKTIFHLPIAQCAEVCCTTEYIIEGTWQEVQRLVMSKQACDDMPKGTAVRSKALDWEHCAFSAAFDQFDLEMYLALEEFKLQESENMSLE